MSFRTKMRLGIILFLVAVLGWDTWLYLLWGYDATISGVIWHWQAEYGWVKWAALPLFLFLWYHWFWGKNERPSDLD